MPELPEVETTRRGVEVHVRGQVIGEVLVRRRDLRQPVTKGMGAIEGKRILEVGRRAKYLWFAVEGAGHLLVHLGMSGSLRVVDASEPWRVHDHVGIGLASGRQLRFHDPRRFGLWLWVKGDLEAHPLLAHLGPEPLGDGFTAAVLRQACEKRTAAIKTVLMDASVVVGVGNIYASEALFLAGISPQVSAAKLSMARLKRLVESVRQVLEQAIAEGGTTLRDFLNSDGQPGYFKQRLFVYGRKGEECRRCGTAIRHAVMGQRSTYWCPSCQK